MISSGEGGGKEDRGAALCAALAFGALMTSAIIFVTFLASTVYLLGDLPFHWVVLSVLAGGVLAFAGVLGMCVRMDGQARYFATVQMVTSLGGLTLTCLGLLFLSWGVGAVQVATLIAAMFTAALLAVRVPCLRTLRYDGRVWRSMLRIGLPLMPLSLFAWFITSADRALLMSAAGAEEVGYYGIASKLAAPVGVVMGAFNMAWLPFALRAVRSDDSNRAIADVFAGFWLVTSLLVPLAAFGVSLTVGWFVPVEYGRHADLIGLFVMKHALMSAYYFPFVVFVAARRTWLATIAYAAGGFVALASSWVLVRVWGAFGVAVGGVTGACVMVVCAAWLARGFRPELYRWRIACGFLLVSAGIAAVPRLYGPLDTIGAASALVAGVSVVGVIAWLTGVVNINAIRRGWTVLRRKLLPVAKGDLCQ